MMWVGRGYFIWCSCWWGTESTKPSFYSDSKNLMAQRWWHVLTSNPLSQAFITRASIRIMCVSCLLRPPCLSSSTVPTPLIRSFVNCCLLVYTRLFVCRCVCVALRASGTWQTAALFLGRLPLPSRGPHWRALALSNLSPPLPAQTLGVEPSMAQLDSLTAANAAAQNLLDLWPVHGPAPTAPHYTALPTDGWTTYWKSSSLVFSKCFRGFHPPTPHPPGKQRSDSAAGLHVHVCAAN